MTDARATREVTVIIPTIGRPDQLRSCLDAITACDPGPGELVVVDQSGEGAATGVADALGDPRIRVLDDDRRGLARARNRGARAARYDVLMFTDDDCLPAREWVGHAWRLHRLHPLSILTGQVLPGNGSAWVPSTIHGTTALDYTGTHQCAVLYPNNMVVRRSELLSHDGFDERFPGAGGEDNDLCYRWLSAGRTLRFEPELVVEHMDWRTMEELEAVQVDYARAQGMFYAKHLRSGDLRMLTFLLADLRVRLRLLGKPSSGPGPIPFIEELRSIARSWRRFAPSGRFRAAE